MFILSLMEVVIHLYSITGTYACEHLDRYVKALNQKAYLANVGKTFGKVAQELDIPLVLRRSTFAAEGLQQMGLATKPQAIKNKSATLPGIEGMIPENGRAGKKGDELRAWERACGPKLECMETKVLEVKNKNRAQHAALIAAIETENRMSQGHLQGKTYIRTPVTRERNGQKQVVVYEDAKGDMTQWVPWTDPPPPNIAYVLADSQGSVLTADTDVILFGQKKLAEDQKHEIIGDSIQGFRTRSSDVAQTKLNSYWKQISGNSNDILQHGDEAHFGLNPINDVLVAYSPEGRSQTFDLTANNSNRQQALRDYAIWLAEMSQKHDIFVPTRNLQTARAEYVKSHYGIALDYKNSAQDYDFIREVGKQHKARFLDPPLEFTDLEAKKPAH